jgi:hypothetical protein
MTVSSDSATPATEHDRCVLSCIAKFDFIGEAECSGIRKVPVHMNVYCSTKVTYKPSVLEFELKIHLTEHSPYQRIIGT